MSFHLATDSTSDLTRALYDQNRITVLPLHFLIDGTEYLDDLTAMSPERFFGLLREGKPSTTSAVNLGQFIEAFSPILEQGEDILYLGFTSELSSTTPTARIAAKELALKYPDRRLVVIDTLCASAGEGLLTLLAAKRRDAGQSLDEVSDWVKNEGAPRIQHWFTVDSLSHLYRGGRLNVVSAIVGGALGIKPVITVTAEGKLTPVAKVRGRRASMVALLERMEPESFDPTICPEVIIGHADTLEDAQVLAQLVQERYPKAEITLCPLGAVIGSHVGPGSLTLLFYGAHR